MMRPVQGDLFDATPGPPAVPVLLVGKLTSAAGRQLHAIPMGHSAKAWCGFNRWHVPRNGSPPVAQLGEPSVSNVSSVACLRCRWNAAEWVTWLQDAGCPLAVVEDEIAATVLGDWLENQGLDLVAWVVRQNGSGLALLHAMRASCGRKWMERARSEWRAHEACRPAT